MRRGMAGAAVVAAAGLVLVAAGTSRVEAATRMARQRHVYGMVGFTSTQSVRLNVVNVTPLPTENQVPPDPYRVRLMLFDDAGHVLARRDAMLGAGQAIALDFGAEVSDALLRREVRAQVDVIVPPNAPPDPCHSTLEVVDRDTLRTSVFVSPAAIHGFNPQPDPPGRQ